MFISLSLSFTDSDPDSLPVDRNRSFLTRGKRLQLVLCCVAVAVLVCAF